MAHSSNERAAEIASGGAKSETSAEGGLPAGLKLLLACAAGLLIANLYYAQPLSGLISEALGMAPGSAGLLFSLPVAGYGVGILIIVPLADLVENRRLALVAVALEVVCVGVIGQIAEPVPFLAIAFLSGITAAAVQVIVPYVSYLAPPAQRGGAVGDVVAGLMLGIMLARPASSFAAHLWSWHSIFYIAAVLQAGLLVLLWFALPPRQPAPGPSYGELLISMGNIFVSNPLLRRRAFYHAFMFGAQRVLDRNSVVVAQPTIPPDTGRDRVGGAGGRCRRRRATDCGTVGRQRLQPIRHRCRNGKRHSCFCAVCFCARQFMAGCGADRS